MAKLTLNTIGSRYGSVDALNDNFDAIEQAFENTFSRDGTGPNSLEATMDANSQRIINLPDPVGNTEPATKGWILAQPGQAAASAVAAAASAAAAAVSETNAEAAAEQVVDWVWKDEWATGVVYKVNNIVAVPSGTYEGWSFVCVVNHTAGATFATDFSAGRWDVLAKRGSAGAGTGDMLAVNNLSELTNISAARTNLGVASATGGGASGTWGISITGNAATVSDNSVSTAKIINGNVTEAKIGTGAVTVDKIGAAAVTGAKLSGAQTGTAPIYGARAWVNFNSVSRSGTYGRAGTLVVINMTTHGMTTGQNVNLTFSAGTGGTATSGSYVVTVLNANDFAITDSVSGTITGSPSVTRNIHIRASGNVSSITDNSTGDYTINFTTAMPDVNYSLVGTSIAYDTSQTGNSVAISGTNTGSPTTMTTSAVRILTGWGGFLRDLSTICVSIHR